MDRSTDGPDKVFLPDTGQLGLPTVTCVEHEFVVIAAPLLHQSGVPEVFYHTIRSYEVGMPRVPFTVRCMRCNLTKECAVPDTCPKCLKGVMGRQDSFMSPDPQGGSRYEPGPYFNQAGADTWACWAVVHHCSGCGFAYVWLQYDR